MNFFYWLLSFIGHSEYARLGGLSRSSKWSAVRNAFIKLHPLCEVCGRRGTLLRPNEVHHEVPFHIDHTKELLFNNLMTACREHHLFVLHLMSWKSYNVSARSDASLWREKILSRP